MSEQYTCAVCGETYEKIRSDEEAMDEAEATFGDALEEPVIVCDDCYTSLGRAE